MKKIIALIAIVVIAGNASAATRRRAVKPRTPSIDIVFNFDQGANGWEAGFADYSRLSTDMDLDSGIRPVPPEAGQGLGFMLHGKNRSDDLFMFLKRKLTVADGIEPNREYIVDFGIRMISDAPAGCGGVGGAPGESVYLKAGATPDEPRVELVGDDYRMTVDIGLQSQGGKAASVAGNIAHDHPCDHFPSYAPIFRSHRHTERIRANGDGTLWLLVGTDSGFEGTTTLYYQEIAVSLMLAD
ncbi:MAG: hypothetical protein ACXV5L_01615 [Thermoanaerobaculia bacterium]